MKVLTYLINLEGSQVRFEGATQQLNAVDWPFERYAAFDGRGKALSEFVDYDDALSQQVLGRSLLNSELGCYLSHYGCAKKFLDTDADYLIVLEDDLSINSQFKAHIDALLNYLHTDCEEDWYLINIAAKKKKLVKDIVRLADFSLWHAFYFPIRGLGLIWSRKGAEAFLSQGKPITMPVDIFFQTWLSKNGKGLGVWPALVKPAGIDSDILGTTATENIARKEKENRSSSYTFKRQKRMWRDRYYAVKHLMSKKSN